MHSTVRTSMWSASSSAGGRVCGVTWSSWSQGPIVSASRTWIQPEGVFQVVRRDVGAGLVDPGRRMVDPERREAEEARLAVEQVPEDTRCIEGREAQPVDRPVRRDERARMAVGQECVIRDRRKRRRCGGALRGCLCGASVLMRRSTARASGRSPTATGQPRPGPTSPAHTSGRGEGRRGAAGRSATSPRPRPGG